MSPSADRLRTVERGIKGMGLALARRLFRPRHTAPLHPDAVRRILIIRQHNQLGDMLCATPLMRAVRARFPMATIALLTSPVNHAVMLHHPALDEVILFDKRTFLEKGRLHAVRLFRFVRDLRKWRFDLVLVPATVSMSATSDLLAYVTGAPWRIGVGSLEGKENPSAFFYTEAVPLAWAGKGDVHQTVRNLDVARGLGLSDPGKSLSMALTQEEREHARSRWFLAQNKPVVAFHVGAGKVPNRWPAERFVSVITTAVSDLGVDVIMISGPMDELPVRGVTDGLSVPYKLITNESIRAVASCLSWVQLLVSNDTGVMHVGAAVGIPVLSIFGPTDPGQWAPVGPQHCCVKSTTVDITDIRVEEVVATMRAMLRSTGATAGRNVS